MARVPLLSEADAWAALPECEGPKGRVPGWGAGLAGRVPSPTAAVLEVDPVQRARSPPPPNLRAQLRWVAARCNRSSYGELYAQDDLERAGANQADMAPLRGNWQNLSESRRLPLEFAAKLTRH